MTTVHFRTCPKCGLSAMKEVAVPTFLVGAITNVDRARLLATMAHAGQKDKAGVPYIDHPAAVAAAVKHLGEDYEIAAWLHDVVEDCGIKMPIIYANFLSIVGDAVGTLTHRVPGTATSLCYEDYILDCRANTIARAVKIADLKHNLLPERICKLKDPLSKMARYHAALAVLEAE